MRFLCVFALLAAAATTACGSTTEDSGPSQANPLDPEEETLLRALQDYRATMGVDPLTLCAALDVSASAHSDDMRDNDYLSETAPDGTKVQQRACKAGYEPGCQNTTMAEAVASGNDSGASTFMQWQTDPTTTQVIADGSLKVAGIGRSIGTDKTWWTLDMGDTTDQKACAGTH